MQYGNIPQIFPSSRDILQRHCSLGSWTFTAESDFSVVPKLWTYERRRGRRSDCFDHQNDTVFISGVICQ